MRAWALKRTDRPSKRARSQRKRLTRTAPPPPTPPPSPPIGPNIRVHFEAAWNDSYSFRRCMHEHTTLLEAAKCAMPNGCGWYVIGVENDEPRELYDAESEVVNHFRFGVSKLVKDSAPD